MPRRIGLRSSGAMQAFCSIRAVVWGAADRLARLLHGSRLGPPTAVERELAADMRRAASALAPLDHMRTADAWWRDRSREFRAGMATENPWDFIRRSIVQRTMFLGDRRVAHKCLSRLRLLPDFESRWRPAIDGVPMGAPLLWAGRTSGQLVWHATAATVYKRLAGQRLEDRDLIVEWGGGSAACAGSYTGSASPGGT